MAEKNTPLDTNTPQGSEVVSLGGGDHTFIRPVRAVYVAATGTIVGRLVNDSADTTWENVPVGDFLRAFSVIRQTGTTATVSHGLV